MRAGTYLKAQCPFHDEKSASFFVSPDRGTYYCFGCGAKGDIFSFVQEFESTDFRGALAMLAEKAGVTIEPWKKDEKDKKEELFEILEKTNLFFESNLKNAKDALVYLKSRGLSIETLKKFRIGFALDEWKSLRNHLSSYQTNKLELAGLIKKGESGDYYDRFRGRIIFPIFDSTSRIIAFSGRTLKKDDEAKYLNSPETPLFEKSKTLFGINFAKQSIREKKEVVLVEGQMDLVMSHQAGVNNTLATSGTSLTYDHLNFIKRMVPTIILGFDADKAGLGASFRGALMALEKGFQVKAISITSGKDPADMVKDSPESWIDAVKNSVPVVDYFLSVISSKDKKDQDSIVMTVVLPLIKAMDNAIEQARSISQTSFTTGIPEQALRKELEKIDIVNTSKNISAGDKKIKGNIRKASALYAFLSESFKEKAEAFKKEYIEITGNDNLDDKSEEIYFEGKLYFDGVSNIDNVVKEILFLIEEGVIKSDFAKSMEDLKKAEAVRDGPKSKELLERCKNLSDRLTQLSKKHNFNSNN